MTLVQNNFLYFYSMFIEMSSMYRHLKVSTMSVSREFGVAEFRVKDNEW